MAPVSRDEFARLVRGLSAVEFARFVADLWRARGWSATVEDGVIVAAGPGGQTRTIALHRKAGWFGRTAPDLPADRRLDAVATSARGPLDVPESVRVVDIDDLRDFALYAVDRDRGDEVFEAYFGRPLADEAAGGGLVSGSTRGLAPSRSVLAVGVVGIVTLVIVLGVVGGGAAFRPFPDSGNATAPSEAESTATPVPLITTAGEDRREDAGTSGPYPPGVSEAGIVDSGTIAEAHARAIEGRSYRLRITYMVFFENELTATRSEVITVESPTEYSSQLRGPPIVYHDPLVIADESSYANGLFRFERTRQNGRVIYRRGPAIPPEAGVDRFTSRVTRYARWFLSVRESRLMAVQRRDGKRFYVIGTRGDPWPGVENASGSAVIDSTGLVHEMRRAYDVPNAPGVSVAITITYGRVGNATVEPPLWIDEARNETGIPYVGSQKPDG